MHKFFRKNKTILIAILCSSLLIGLAFITTNCEFIGVEKKSDWLYCFLMNPYVSGVIYTIGLLYIVYAFQITVSKRKIKRDFRCNEVMEAVDDSIVKLVELFNTKRNDDVYKDFIIKNRVELSIIKTGLTYYKNEILIDSLKMCFFFNINFELMGIINNIKNRLPNITDEKKKVGKYLALGNNGNGDFEEYEAENYLTDLIFLARYWKTLLNYLDYDNTYSREVVKYYNYFFEKEGPMSIEDMSVRMDMIQKTFDKEIKKKVKAQKRRNKYN